MIEVALGHDPGEDALPVLNTDGHLRRLILASMSQRGGTGSPHFLGEQSETRKGSHVPEVAQHVRDSARAHPSSLDCGVCLLFMVPFGGPLRHLSLGFPAPAPPTPDVACLCWERQALGVPACPCRVCQIARPKHPLVPSSSSGQSHTPKLAKVTTVLLPRDRLLPKGGDWLPCCCYERRRALHSSAARRTHQVCGPHLDAMLLPVQPEAGGWPCSALAVAVL